MSGRCPLFVELCAGLASVSLMLQGGKYARPPVSRMGNKHGYGLALLRVMGLRPGQGADRYLWCEPDPGCRALLHAYTDREVMQEAARIIRSWKDEEPRALWERLRAEGPIRVGEAREVARGAVVAKWSAYQSNESGYAGPGVSEGCFRDRDKYLGCVYTAGRMEAPPTLPATVTPDARAVEPREVAREILTTAWSTNGKTGNGAGYRGEGGNTGDFGGPLLRASSMPARAEAVPETPATVTPDARAVDPREVARWSLVRAWGYGTGDEMTQRAYFGPGLVPPSKSEGWTPGLTAEGLIGRMGEAPEVSGVTSADARAIEPADLPHGTVVFIDPPYVGTTGYGNDLPREDVVSMARRWAEAGARVYISEAEPIGALVAEGWHTVEITSQRVGQKRTFSKQQREWVTCSVEPSWLPGVQLGLFGSG